MLKKEIRTLFKIRTPVIVMSIMILLIALDVFFEFEDNKKKYEALEKAGYSADNIKDFHPVDAALLSDTSSGLTGEIVIQILPVFLLILGANSYIRERRNKYSSIILIRTTRKKYILSKYALSFIISSGAMFLGLSLNLMLSMIVFHGGTNFRYKESRIKLVGEPVIEYMYEHPYGTYIFYMICMLLVTGMLSVICTSIAFILKKAPYTYVISIIIWFFMLSGNFSIYYVIMAFTGRGTFSFCMAFIQLIIIAFVVTILAYRRMMTEDEM